MLEQYQNLIIKILIVSIIFGALLIFAEILKRRNIIQQELARKSVHITAGIILVSLPLFMNRWEVVTTNFVFLISVIFFTGVLHVFTVVHAVKRWTIGEYLYPLSTGLIALFFTDLRVYSFAVFILALADGLAGLTGKKYGGKGYHIWHGTKSILGNAVFFIITFCLIAGFWSSVQEISWSAIPMMFVFSIWLTAVESMFAGGFDNITVSFSAAFIAWYILL